MRREFASACGSCGLTVARTARCSGYSDDPGPLEEYLTALIEGEPRPDRGMLETLQKDLVDFVGDGAQPVCGRAARAGGGK